MSIRSEVFKDIAEETWLKYELEIFNRLKAGEYIHGNRYVTIRREMERLGCPSDIADRYIQNQLYGMREQIAEQAAVS